MTSRGSSRRASASADGVDAARIGAWLIVVLAAPRILRMLYPEIWVEDDFYLESAWLVSVGMRPYIDFIQPHMPLLEWIAAGYLKLFGASHLSIEFLNEAAIFATSLLTYALARRVAGRPAAIAASILYAYGSLVFRYHVYERESFVAPLLILGAIVTLDDAMPPIRQAAILAGIFFLACAIKLTAAIAFPVMLVFIAVAYRRIASAVASGVIFTLALAAFSAILYRLYGGEFIFQTFVFHFLKGRDTAGDIATYPRMILDLLVPLFVLGCWQIYADRIFSRGMILVLAIVAAEYAFYGVLSPTAWGHNYLEPIPFIAIVAGVGAIALVDAVRTAPPRWNLLAAGAALIVISLVWIAPLINENWLHGAVYGFGFVPRAEISQLADGLARRQQTGRRRDRAVIRMLRGRPPRIDPLPGNLRRLSRSESRVRSRRLLRRAPPPRRGRLFPAHRRHPPLLDRADARRDRERQSLGRHQRLANPVVASGVGARRFPDEQRLPPNAGDRSLHAVDPNSRAHRAADSVEE